MSRTDEPEVLAEERVDLPGRATEIRIGRGIRRLLRGELRRRFPRAVRFGLAGDRTVLATWPARSSFPGRVPEALRAAVPAGEAAKTRAVLARLQDRFVVLARDEPVVAFGGGATIDVVGFAAATLRRGLPWVAVPTTVVGMADAAVGGKVAVNLPAGKNLLGAFHPPALVLADVELLETLPRRDLVAGLAEAWKVGRVGDSALVDLLARGVPEGPAAWVEVIRRAVAVKARIVERDERDVGERRALNYGHTIGHPLETLLGNEAMRHGEAVAIGMGVADRIAVARNLLDAATAAESRAALGRLGLPTAVPAGVRAEDLLRIAALDKKRSPGDRHTFALPRGASGVVVVEDVTPEEVVAAIGACRRANGDDPRSG